MNRRALLLAALAAGLLAVAVVALVSGVETRTTTGGLLVTPVPQVRLIGGRLLAGTAAGVAAVLVGLAAWGRWRDAARPGGTRLTRAPTEGLGD